MKSNPAIRQLLQKVSDRKVRVEEALIELQGAASAGPKSEPALLAAEAAVAPRAEAGVRPEADDQLFEFTLAYLKKRFAERLGLPFERFDPKSTFEPYGVDSIAVVDLVRLLEKDFGPLPKTLLFEVNSLEKLTRFFLEKHRPALTKLFLPGAHELSDRLQALPTRPSGAKTPLPQPATTPRASAPSPARVCDGDIAIVGMAGRYPGSRNLREFWRNLSEGTNCISEIPPDRWDQRKFFNAAEPNPCYSKWGGFIEDADKFDSLFFNISPKEAEQMDPQERVFLEVAWETLEDAGYTRERLARACQTTSDVGVFVGVMYGAYQLYGASSDLPASGPGPSSPYWSIANRVSYFCNFHGPSMAVDTACSASLTAIHLACQSLRAGECKAALAGGVTLIVHPNQFVPLATMKMLSRDDKCRVFGEGADGFVDGEGAGAVLLRPLADAVREGDRIYGVIKSSSVNAGGKTSGYTVPNPNAQADLIAAALERAKINPETLGYIECHGTGTALGDPIEIAGLTNAFQRYTKARQFCGVGSVKSVIGHAQAAAGIAGLTKVLLQFEHGKLAPTLHAEKLNPYIDFENSPFYVVRALTDWARPAGSGNEPRQRRAGISSFGIGGANAHLIVEEFCPTTDAVKEIHSDSAPPQLLVWSARTEERLRAMLQVFSDWLKGLPSVAEPSVVEIARTLAIGREAMECRFAIVATTRAEIAAKLERFLGGALDPDMLFSGNLAPDHPLVAALRNLLSERRWMQELIQETDLRKLGALWTAGFNLDWEAVYPDKPRRIVRLPSYPFLKRSFWPQVQPSASSVRVQPQPKLESRLFSEGKENGHAANGASNGKAAPLAGADELAQWVRENLAKELKMDLADLSLDKAFNDFGVDSLVGANLAKQLGDRLGIEVNVTLLWEHPTIRALTQFLSQRAVPDGTAVGPCDSATVGRWDGATVGPCDGATVGRCDGAAVGRGDSATVGPCDGETVGRGDGALEKALSALNPDQASAYFADLLRDSSESLERERTSWLNGPSSKTALIIQQRQFSYADLLDIERRLAALLHDRGLSTGVTVGVMCGSSAQSLLAVVGILAAGGRPLLASGTEDLRTAIAGGNSKPLLVLTSGGELAAPGCLGISIDDLCGAVGVDKTVTTAERTDHVPQRASPFLFPPIAELAQRLDGADKQLRADDVLLVKMSGAEPDPIFHILSALRSGATVVLDEPAGEDTLPMARSSRRGLAFSLLFFSSKGTEQGEKYDLLLNAVRFADQHGFEAAWIPERHFHPVGGLFPNPSVVAAALAMVTRQIRLRAGSVVLPLHHPIRVVEEWSIVDNLSGGRVDLSIARGWNPNDFVISPETFQPDNALLISRLEIVRRLWRGEEVAFPNPKGEMVPVRIFPSPKQRELPVWMTCVGGPERFREAASLDAGVLTMLFNQNLDALSQKIAAYRAARAEQGFAAEAGKISLMLHAFVHSNMDVVREKVRGPFLDYIKSTIDLHRHGARTRGIDSLDEEKQRVAEYSYERYFRTGALFGTPDSCRDFITAVEAAGVNEIACQIDFGIDSETVLESLAHLAELKERCAVRAGANRQDPGRAKLLGLIQKFRVTHVYADPAGARSLLQSAELKNRAIQILDKPSWDVPPSESFAMGKNGLDAIPQ